MLSFVGILTSIGGTSKSLSFSPPESAGLQADAFFILQNDIRGLFGLADDGLESVSNRVHLIDFAARRTAPNVSSRSPVSCRRRYYSRSRPEA